MTNHDGTFRDKVARLEPFDSMKHFGVILQGANTLSKRLMEVFEGRREHRRDEMC